MGCSEERAESSDKHLALDLDFVRLAGSVTKVAEHAPNALDLRVQRVKKKIVGAPSKMGFRFCS